MVDLTYHGGVARCGWCGDDPAYSDYHDNEWGRLRIDDRTLFEMLLLEGAQAGLSWITILRRREGYRRAFAGFDPEAVAQFTESDVERLMQDEGIIRNRLKIKSAIKNARLFLDLVDQRGSFADYLLSFFPDGKPIVNQPQTLADIPASTPISDAIARDMKKRGFTFFGTTICYAFLQSTGFIDDHLAGCHCKNAAK